MSVGKRVELRIPPGLYAECADRASAVGIPVATWIKTALHQYVHGQVPAQAPANNKSQTKQVDKPANLSDEDYERFVDEVRSYGQALSMFESGKFTKRQLEQGYRRLAMDGSPGKPEPFELTATPAVVARLDKDAAEMVVMVQTIWREHESAPAPVVHHARPASLSATPTNVGTVVEELGGKTVDELLAEWDD